MREACSRDARDILFRFASLRSRGHSLTPLSLPPGLWNCRFRGFYTFGLPIYSLAYRFARADNISNWILKRNSDTYSGVHGDRLP